MKIIKTYNGDYEIDNLGDHFTVQLYFNDEEVFSTEKEALYAIHRHVLSSLWRNAPKYNHNGNMSKIQMILDYINEYDKRRDLFELVLSHYTSSEQFVDIISILHEGSSEDFNKFDEELLNTFFKVYDELEKKYLDIVIE
jgi:hypothetical protein